MIASKLVPVNANLTPSFSDMAFAMLTLPALSFPVLHELVRRPVVEGRDLDAAVAILDGQGIVKGFVDAFRTGGSRADGGGSAVPTNRLASPAPWAALMDCITFPSSLLSGRQVGPESGSARSGLYCSAYPSKPLCEHFSQYDHRKTGAVKP